MRRPDAPATSEAFDYVLVRSRRKSIGIQVKDDGCVEVRAPLRESQRSIDEALDRHHAWILERSRACLERRTRLRRRRFDDGEAIPYLGRTLELRLLDTAGPERPRVDGERLLVRRPSGLDAAASAAAIRTAVGGFLVERSADVFHDRHVAMSRLVGESALRITIKDMRSRWGSCGPKRRMSLSWRLILAPLDVIDYVIAHELTHIRHPDHSRRFWDDLARSLPGWRRSRDWLRAHGDDLQL